MGYRVSWIARRGPSSDVLLSALNLARTGEHDEFLDVGWYLLDLTEDDAAGWTLLIADGSDYFALLKEEHAEALSSHGGETLYYWCSDTLMNSAIAAYRDGRKLWAVEYDCEHEGGPRISGDAPQLIRDLDNRVRQEQARENEAEDEPADILYGLTATVGEALTRFNHDPSPEADEDPFEGMLERLQPS